MGQPGLSQAIAHLEDMLGVRLIERTTRSVRLTPAGEEAVVEARRVLEAYDRFLRRGAEWAHVDRGRIELLTIPSMAHRVLPALVRAFSARHANVSVDVQDYPDPLLRQRLERNEGDLAIITHTGNAGVRAALPFLRDRFRVVLPAGHRLAAQQVIDAKQLASEPLILLRRGTLYRSFMDAAIADLPLAHSPIEVAQTATLIGMVDAGLGVSLLPALSCPRGMRSVTTRPLEKPEISRLIAFAQPVDRDLMPAVEAFVRISLDLLSTGKNELPEGCEFLRVGPHKLKQFFAAGPARSRARAT